MLMTKRVADVVVETLRDLGITDAFSVTGGAAMHLNDAFGRCAGINNHYMHHEQACAMAAEGYARIDWKPAAVCVTAGPGAINALNGVFGAYTDSIPMIIVSGQSRSDTLVSAIDNPSGLRQLGDQEADVISMAKVICKKTHTLSAEDDIRGVVKDLFFSSISGRPGPVWLEVPVDIQGKEYVSGGDRKVPIDTETGSEVDELSRADLVDNLVERLRNAERPVIIAGTGIRAAGVTESLLQLAERGRLPVTTAWTHDVFPNSHELFAGRPGTIGTRAGNLIVQASDLVLVLGSRLNIRQVSYNWEQFAACADLIHVDIDEAELRKPYLRDRSGLKIHADLKEFLPLLASRVSPPMDSRQGWIDWVAKVRRDWEPKPEDYSISESGINPYHFFMELNTNLCSTDIVVSGDATACIVPFQTLFLSEGMRMFSNSGSASMGYDLPAALGASVASKDRRVVCLAGDGSIMMNLQELQTLKAWDPNVKLFVLDNNGYLSIKQTQSNFFGRSNGASPDSGLSFPNFESVAAGFGLSASTLEIGSNWKGKLREVMKYRDPQVCVVKLNQDQEFEPRLKSRMTKKGIVTPPLDDMYPHIDSVTLNELRESAVRTSEQVRGTISE